MGDPLAAEPARPAAGSSGKQGIRQAVRGLASISTPELAKPWRYAIAPAAALLAFAVQYAFLPQPDIAPFLFFYFSVALASWLGRRLSGLLTVACSALVANYMFIAPPRAWSFSAPALTATGLFVVSSALVALLCSAFREAVSRAERLAGALGRQASLLQLASDAILVWRLGGAIESWNRGAEALYDFSSGEALGNAPHALLQTVLPRPWKEIEAELRRHGRWEGDLAHRARSGRRVVVLAKLQLVRGGDGGNLVLETNRDITERKMAEEALRESEQRVRLKLESITSPGGDVGDLGLAELIDVPAMQSLMDEFYKLAQIPMSIVDLQGRVLVGVGWQDVCIRFHRAHPDTCQSCIESDTRLSAGTAPGEFKLYRCQNHMWDAATPIVVDGKHLGNVFTGQFFFDDEIPEADLFRASAKAHGFDQAEYLAALERVPRLSHTAVATGMAFFLKLADALSKLGHSNARLARLVSERDALMSSLRETDRRRTEFLATLSHELRNPLAPICNSIHILGRVAPGSEPARRAQEVIERQAKHLSRLVDDLLDVTRISHGKIRLQRERLELNGLLRRTAEDHRELFATCGIALEIAVDDQPLHVEADPTRLGQVVGNLLQNAAKFARRGGHARLALEAPAGGFAQIRVSDDGVGIPAETMTRLFEPFVQADQTLDRSRGGLGLGLAAVKGLVELHGGSVSAHSQGLGQGAEFTIRLPLQRPAAGDLAEGARAMRATP